MNSPELVKSLDSASSESDETLVKLIINFKQ